MFLIADLIFKWKTVGNGLFFDIERLNYFWVWYLIIIILLSILLHIFLPIILVFFFLKWDNNNKARDWFKNLNLSKLKASSILSSFKFDPWHYSSTFRCIDEYHLFRKSSFSLIGRFYSQNHSSTFKLHYVP